MRTGGGGQPVETVPRAGRNYWTDGCTTERARPRPRHYNARVKFWKKERKKEAKENARVRTHLTHTHTHSFTEWQGASLYYQLDSFLCAYKAWTLGVGDDTSKCLCFPRFASDLLHQNRWCREPPEVSCPHHKYKLVTEEVSQLQIYPTRAGVSPVRFDKKINDEKILETGPFTASWLEKWQLL